MKLRGALLLARRRTGERFAGYWELPGGKLEDGEDLQVCLKREIREELGFDIVAGEVLFSTAVHSGSRRIELFALHVQSSTGALSLSVHDRIRWAHPGEWRDYPVLEADHHVLEVLRDTWNTLKPTLWS